MDRRKIIDEIDSIIDITIKQPSCVQSKYQKLIYLLKILFSCPLPRFIAPGTWSFRLGFHVGWCYFGI